MWVGAVALLALGVTGVLLWISRTPGVRLNPNRTSVTLQIPVQNIAYPALSRDGKWVAFPAADENGKWDVYLMNIAGGKPNRVTYESATYIIIVDISPDVSQIAYSSLNEANPFFMVRLVGSQGGGSRTLVDSGVALWWRPDGQRIGYMRLGSGAAMAPSTSGKLEIWSIRSDGTDKRLEFTDSVSSKPVPFALGWSPDGESIPLTNSPPGPPTSGIGRK